MGVKPPVRSPKKYGGGAFGKVIFGVEPSVRLCKGYGVEPLAS